MPVNSFMNVKAVAQYLNPNRVIVVFIALTELFHVHLFKMRDVVVKS